MIQFVVASLVTGILFGILDGLINGNPLAVRLLECYKPVARQSINITAGFIIDLLYGFIISAVYIAVSPVISSGSWVIKGLLYGTAIWLFRVVMNVLSTWMMLNIPAKTLLYLLIAGLFEMLILGLVNGFIFRNK